VWSRISAVVRKEFIQIRRDRRTLAIVLVMPVMQLLLFGYAINTVIDHLPTIVFDEARDADSRALVAAFQNSGYFDVVAHARSQAEIVDAVDAGRAKVGLLIPPSFGDQVLRGQPGPAQVLVDGSDPNIAQTAMFAAGMIAQAHSAEVTADVVERLGRTRPAGGVDLRPVVLYNPSMLSTG
jgi:ABC-2 type transport system permease protein